MTTLAYSSGLPTPASTLNSIAAPEIVSAFNQILAYINGTNIDGSNVAATLTGRKLLLSGYTQFVSGTTAQTFLADPKGGITLQPGGNISTPPAWAHLDPATFAVTGKANTQMILRLSAATNATAPASNFTAALAPAAFAGAVSANFTVTPGSAVSGSSVTLNTPSGSSASVIESAPFTFPAAGAYVMTLANSATIAASNYTSLVVQLFALNS